MMKDPRPAPSPVTRRTADARREASRSFLVEAASCLRAGESVVLLGGSGMGRTSALEVVLGEALGESDVQLAVRVPRTPFRGYAERLRSLHRSIVREASVRARADAMWDGVVESLRQRSGAESGIGSADLAAEFGLLWETLRDVAEVTDQVIVVVDGLRRWLPIHDAQNARPRESEEALRGLRDLLEDVGPATLRLLSADTPDANVSGSPLDDLLLVTECVALEPMTEKDVRVLLAGLSPDLDAGDAAHVYRMVGGHPRLAKLLGGQLLRWRLRRGALDDTDRMSLTRAVDGAVRKVVERSLAALRRMGEGELIDRLFEAASTAEPQAFGARDLTVLWPFGLVDARDRIPERLRAIIAGGAAIARGATVGGVSRARLVPSATEGGGQEGSGGTAVQAAGGLASGDPANQLGRKERLLFNYLRKAVGEPVSWPELAAAYFANEPTALEDEEKALRTLRATVNRINAKLAPGPRAAKSGWKIVRYMRGGRGFFLDTEAMESLDLRH